MANPAYYVDSSGSVVPVPPEQAADAAQIGWVPASEQQVKDFQVDQKYGTTGQEAITALESAGSALTFGLSTHAEKALGVPAEDIAGREKANPVASGLGTAAGVALPFVATLGGASAVTAPSLIAKAGQAATRATEAVLPEAGTALGRMAVKATALGVGSAIEGAAYGAGQVVHESALGDPSFTAQSALATVGLSAALGAGIGGAGGILAQGFRELGPSDLGGKLRTWLGEFEGERNLKAAGAIKSDIGRLVDQKGRGNLNAIGREAGEMGLMGPLSTPGVTLEKAQAVMEDTGQKMGALLRTADATAGEAAPKMASVLVKAGDEVLSEMRANPFQAPLAEKLGQTLAGYGDQQGFTALHEIRKQVSDEIYGLRGQLDPEGSYKRSALRKVRGLISDELNDGLDKAGMGSSEWKALNRRYEVATTVSDVADAGVNRAHGNNLVSPLEFIGGMTGLANAGPAGAAMTGLATAAVRRHASGTLGAAARVLRKALDGDAAGVVAGKTSEAIGAARQAGADSLTAQATNQPETVAALSLLERMRQSVENRIDDGMSAVVRAGPQAVKVGRGEVAAASAKFSERTQQIRSLAQNPPELHSLLERQTDDWHEHAPQTAQAVQLSSARAVNFLASKVPNHEPAGPLAKAWEPSKSEIAKFSRYWEAVHNPQSVLKLAAAGTLTPEAVEAVRVVYPAIYEKMCEVAVEKLTSQKAVPYKARLMLSMLLGQNIDGTTNGMTIVRNQMAVTPKQQNQPTPARADKVKFADRAATEGQRGENRGEP